MRDMVDMGTGLLRLHFPTHVNERGFLLQEKERVVLWRPLLLLVVVVPVVMMMHGCVNAAVGLLLLCVACIDGGPGGFRRRASVLVLVEGKVACLFVWCVALRCVKVLDLQTEFSGDSISIMHCFCSRHIRSLLELLLLQPQTTNTGISTDPRHY